MNFTWAYSEDHRQICQIIESHTLWGETTCRVWLPDRDSMVRILASKQEEHAWNEEIERKALVYPEMSPLLIIRIGEGAYE